MERILMMAAAVAMPVFTQAALPPTSECQVRQRLTNANQVLSLKPEQVVWNCLDLSALSKAELLQLAPKAPQLYIRISGSPLNRNDLIEINKQHKITVEVDNGRFNKIDIQELQKAGVETIVIAASVPLSVTDYRELAANGPLTVELGTPAISQRELTELVQQKNLKFVIDRTRAGLDETAIQTILDLAPETRLRF